MFLSQTCQRPQRVLDPLTTVLPEEIEGYSKHETARHPQQSHRRLAAKLVMHGVDEVRQIGYEQNPVDSSHDGVVLFLPDVTDCFLRYVNRFLERVALHWPRRDVIFSCFNVNNVLPVVTLNTINDK